MSLFGSFFSKPRTQSAVLISLGPGAVLGACAWYQEGRVPFILYAKRIPIEQGSARSSEQAMIAALEKLCLALQSEGAPAMQRDTGSGSADAVIVSIDAPWQTTAMRVERIEEPKPFTLTSRFISEHLSSASAVPDGQILVDESLVGTIVNGYETQQPFGKRASHVTLIMLVSSVVRTVAEAVALVLRRAYHTKNILLIAGASMRYQAVRAAFPLERDCLILDASGPEISLALVRRGLLVATYDAPDGVAGDAAWIDEIKKGLGSLAEKYPLPQLIFLIAPSENAEKLATVLSASTLGALWLSENPPKVIALAASHVSTLVKNLHDAAPDLELSLLALYGGQSIAGG